MQQYNNPAMYTNEGLRRIHLLGKRIMLFGTLAAVVFWLLETFVLRGPGNTSIAPFELLILMIYPLLLGGTLWVIAWVVEGFLTSSSHE